MTDIKCLDCDHVRETTEEFPTLATCENCGSWNVAYKDHADDQLTAL
jgi:Zn finger protein HypA/HybF involved in hydrogenase expression